MRAEWMKMTRSIARFTAGALLATASLAGCAGGEEKADEVEVTVKPGEAEVEVGAEKAGAEVRPELGLPVYQPLTFKEGELAVEKLGEYDGVTAYEVGDVTVLHKLTPANSVVAARVYLLGGSANLTDQTAGLERLALNTAVSGGTESLSKDEFNARLDSMGSSVGAVAERDYSAFSMQSVVANFDQTWELMEQAILEPAIPAEELELQRTRQLAEIRSLKDDPDRLVGYTATKLLFEGHPYYTFQLGTEETVSTFTQPEVAAYHAAILDPARMTVVVVGNVPAEAVIEKVKAKLGRIEPRAVATQELHPFEADKPELRVEEKPIPTNYIFGLFPAPAPGDADYPAMLVASEFLRDRLFEEVRTKRNLTYAVSSGLSDKRTNYGYLYVTAVDPAATMPVIFAEVDKLKSGEFTAEELEQSRNVFLTEHFMSLETNSSQASILAEAALVAGDWKTHADFMDEVKAVTAEDVQRVASKYMKNYHFGIVGDPAKIDEALFLGAKAATAAPKKAEAGDDKPAKLPVETE